MRLVDANVLLYATNENDERHGVARAWLTRALGGREAVGFDWAVLLAFLRLATHPAVFHEPLTPLLAIEQIRAWLGGPAAVIVEPTSSHLETLARLVGAAGTAGNLVNDAHLAALAIEYEGTVISFDRDFGRFPAVRWEVPA